MRSSMRLVHRSRCRSLSSTMHYRSRSETPPSVATHPVFGRERTDLQTCVTAPNCWAVHSTHFRSTENGRYAHSYRSPRANGTDQ